jgi:hypothetical protein
VGWAIRGSNPGMYKRFFFSPSDPDRLWDPLSLIINGYRDSIQEIKRSGRDVGQSPPSNSEVNNQYCCTSTPPIHLQGVDRDNFSFISILCNFYFKSLLLTFLMSSFLCCSYQKGRMGEVWDSLSPTPTPLPKHSSTVPYVSRSQSSNG